MIVVKSAILCFGQASGVGKDTAARIAMKRCRETSWHYPRHLKFSGPLKEEAYRLFEPYGMQPGDFYERPENAHLRDVVLPRLGLTPRQVWIKLGDQLRQIHEGVFVDRIPMEDHFMIREDQKFLQPEDRDRQQLLIFSDLRRPYEALRALSLADKYPDLCEAWLVRIDRPGTKAHELDHSPLHYNRPPIVNDGTPEEFETKIVALVDDLLRTCRGGA